MERKIEKKKVEITSRLSERLKEKSRLKNVVRKWRANREKMESENGERKLRIAR